MTTREVTDTERVLVDMLTENTGTHMLDSGGAYGRSWQRNQAATESADDPVKFWRDLPEVTTDDWGCVSVSVFHFLSERVDYDAKLDRVWRTWVSLDPSERWSDSYRYFNAPSTADAFLALMDEKGYISHDGEWSDMRWVNTYNGEDALSQVLQYRIFEVSEKGAKFTDNGEGYYVLLSIHGGADVRGGYTDLRAFYLQDWDGVVALLDNARLYARCAGIDPPQEETLFGSNPDPCHSFDSDDAGYSWQTDGHADGMAWDEDAKIYRCSCGATVSIYPPIAG